MLRTRTIQLTRPASRYFASSCQSYNASTSTQQEPSTRSLTPEEKRHLEPMIRVDQSGEVGAYYIYKGQMAVLGGDKALRPLLQEMWDQEKKHLELFNGLVGEHRVRPSLLRPVWEIAGFAVGAGTALLGKEAAMACTEAVETVIGNHYNDQLRELHGFKPHNQQLTYLSETIATCRDEELEHHDIAVAHDAHRAPFHSALSAVIKQGCKGAIWIAERDSAHRVICTPHTEALNSARTTRITFPSALIFASSSLLHHFLFSPSTLLPHYERPRRKTNDDERTIRYDDDDDDNDDNDDNDDSTTTLDHLLRLF